MAVCSAFVYWRTSVPSASALVEASLTELGDALPPLVARLGSPTKSTECGRSLPAPSAAARLGLGVAVGERHATEVLSVCEMQHLQFQILRVQAFIDCCDTAIDLQVSIRESPDASAKVNPLSLVPASIYQEPGYLVDRYLIRILNQVSISYLVLTMCSSCSTV